MAATAREAALGVALSASAAWLLWAERLSGSGVRGVLATAGLWWLAAAQATWPVWLPALVVLVALRTALREPGTAGTGALGALRPRQGTPPGPSIPVPPPVPNPLSRIGTGERVGSEGHTEPPDVADAGGDRPVSRGDLRPTPRPLVRRPVPIRAAYPHDTHDAEDTDDGDESEARSPFPGWGGVHERADAAILDYLRGHDGGAQNVPAAEIGLALGKTEKYIRNRAGKLRKAGLVADAAGAPVKTLRLVVPAPLEIPGQELEGAAG